MRKIDFSGSGIYKIESRIKPNRIYIGSAVDLKSRVSLHIHQLIKGKHHSIKLQNHFNKYGIDDLVFSLFINCNIDRLIIEEQKYIDLLNPYFNICRIAGSCIGRSISEDTKNKMRYARIGKKPNLGNKFSNESKKKMSDSHKGKKLPPEQIEKIRYKLTGKKRTDAQKLVYSECHKGNKAYWFGKKLPEETRIKMRLAHQKRQKLNTAICYEK